MDTGATARPDRRRRAATACASLDPGDYEVRVELTGFKTVVRSGVVLRVGGASVQDVTLGLGAASPRR